MARREQVVRAAYDYCKPTSEPQPNGALAFEMGAKWADEHPKDNLVDIDKACDTIKYLLGGYIIRNFHSGDSYDIDKIIDDFKKELKGE